jgi:hypothetical protein
MSFAAPIAEWPEELRCLYVDALPAIVKCELMLPVQAVVAGAAAGKYHLEQWRPSTGRKSGAD